MTGPLSLAFETKCITRCTIVKKLGGNSCSISHRVFAISYCTLSNSDKSKTLAHNFLKREHNLIISITNLACDYECIDAWQTIENKSCIRIWQSWLFKLKSFRSFKLKPLEIFEEYPSRTLISFKPVEKLFPCCSIRYSMQGIYMASD